MGHHSCKSIGEVAALGRRLVKRNQHFVWATFGDPGSGKSEFNLIFAKALQGEWPDIKTQVAFRPKDRVKMARGLGRFKVILDDEATGEGGNKRRPMAKDNVDNAMDMDACRGRNQFVGFACPDGKRLDSGVLDHLMWFFVMSKDHGLKAYETYKYGPPLNRKLGSRLRFKLDPGEVPFLGDLNPELRQEYLDAKEAHMRGHTTDEAQLVHQIESQAQKALLRVLGRPDP